MLENITFKKFDIFKYGFYKHMKNFTIGDKL